jgi:hypothetical protein
VSCGILPEEIQNGGLKPDDSSSQVQITSSKQANEHHSKWCGFDEKSIMLISSAWFVRQARRKTGVCCHLLMSSHVLMKLETPWGFSRTVVSRVRHD